jgi:transcriptional regulator with XRE-family HTH domain
MTQTQLAEKSGVSQRMISGILSSEHGCSVETAEALAGAFKLRGWHLIMRKLPPELLDSPALSNLMDSYINATPANRDLIDRLTALYKSASNGD